MNKYTECVDRCLDWAENVMLSYNRGSVGFYERIRIDVNRRVAWNRPDCNTELLRLLLLRGRESDRDVFDNVSAWLLSAQDNDPLSAWYGSFPFYQRDGESLPNDGVTRYQNDNGKILVALTDIFALCGDARFRDSALRLAEYWLSIQRPEGYFFRADGRTNFNYKSPCFVAWLAAGMACCFGMTGDERFRESAERAADFLLTLRTPSGRLRTSYELLKTEDWRPPSSENAIGVFCLARIIKYIDKPEYRRALREILDYTLSLADECGGIRNADDESLPASLQENKSICDLVYTQGYALMAFREAHALTGDSRVGLAADKLADFLASIQCRGESPLWDGAWRGAYNVDIKSWDGRCNQNNGIDEGGMYSVYTGWCAAPICTGMLMR